MCRYALVLTEAPFNLPAVMAEQDDVIFNHFGGAVHDDSP